LCKIVWEGQIPSKANPGQRYHVFKVFVNANETLSASDIPVANVATPAVAPQQMATASSPSDVLDADDLDMPF
jgi:hypothetical protein